MSAVAAAGAPAAAAEGTGPALLARVGSEAALLVAAGAEVADLVTDGEGAAVVLAGGTSAAFLVGGGTAALLWAVARVEAAGAVAAGVLAGAGAGGVTSFAGADKAARSAASDCVAGRVLRTASDVGAGADWVSTAGAAGSRTSASVRVIEYRYKPHPVAAKRPRSANANVRVFEPRRTRAGSVAGGTTG